MLSLHVWENFRPLHVFFFSIVASGNKTKAGLLTGHAMKDAKDA